MPELTGRSISRHDHLRIANRNLKAACLAPSTSSCHSFRSSTHTDVFKNEVPREEIQFFLGNSDACTIDP
jgi:integrase/recombinase XerD